MLVTKEIIKHPSARIIASSQAHPAWAQARAERVFLAAHCPNCSKIRAPGPRAQDCEHPLHLILRLQGFHTSFSAEGQTQCKWIATCLITHVDFGRVSRKSYALLDPRNYLENASSDQSSVYNVLVLDFLWFPDSLIQIFPSLLLPQLRGC